MEMIACNINIISAEWIHTTAHNLYILTYITTRNNTHTQCFGFSCFSCFVHRCIGLADPIFMVTSSAQPLQMWLHRFRRKSGMLRHEICNFLQFITFTKTTPPLRDRILCGYDGILRALGGCGLEDEVDILPTGMLLFSPKLRRNVYSCKMCM